MVNGKRCPTNRRWNMKTNAETTAVQTQSLRFSAAARAAMKQDELSVSANALESLTHALRFR
jgi:hypothetical protein